MPGKTLTIAMNGTVHLDDFARGIDCFRRLIAGLSSEVAAGAKSQWVVDSLEAGSAIATIRGEGEKVSEVIKAYERTGRALMKNQEIPFGISVKKPARDLISLINSHVTSIRFETEGFDAEIFSGTQTESEEVEFEINFGAVHGRIQSVSNRGGLRFTLYDDIDDHAVSCYIKQGNEDQLREAWGRFVTVEGTVRRNCITGKAATVRQVSNIEVISERNPNEWREAIGCAPAVDGSISAEEAIRKIRDD